MARAGQVMVGLGLAALWLVWGPGPVGEPPPARMERRGNPRVGKSTPMAPEAGVAAEVGRKAPLELMAQPGVEGGPPGGSIPATVQERAGPAPRFPAQIAPLVKRRHLEAVIAKYARQYGVDQDLVWAVIRQESGFDAQAVSPKGAKGLMQLMPGTAAMLGVTDAFDVEQNIAGGVKYLERCLSQFGQDVGLALAAYNAGPDNVVKHEGCPPFAETRHYVASVLKAYAGEPGQEDLRRCGLSAVRDTEVSDSTSPGGLTWRVPQVRWRIATPQCKVSSPRWKAALLPF